MHSPVNCLGRKSLLQYSFRILVKRLKTFVSICRSVIKLFTLSYLHFGQPNSGTDPLRARADRALAGLHGAELLELPVGAAVA